MQKTKKQLLGLAGLAIVAVMTAIAISLPAPGAAAAEQDSKTVQLNVRVSEGNTSVSFVAPEDGSHTVKPAIDVAVNYSEAAKIEYTLYPLDNAGIELPGQSVSLGTYDVSATASGTDKRTFNLSDYGLSYGYYKIKATATGNTSEKDDTTKFHYDAMIVTNTNKTAANSDPIFEVEISEGVEKVQMQVLDGDKFFFVDADGKNSPLLLDRSMIDPATGKITVTLPFEKFNIPNGRYTLHSVAYDADNKDVDTVTNIIVYDRNHPNPGPSQPTDPNDPNTPDTPNTGAILDDTNISRLDYLLTGLIAFGAVAGFAVYLIHRRDRR